MARVTDYYCSKCKVEITEKEFNYSKEHFGRALCREHQNKTETNNSKKTIETNGLSKQKGKYTEDMIKGRIAETLIEELFLSLGYDVFRYGMENTVPGIMSLLKGVKDEVADNIRRMPDFVIQKDKKVFFIEVKFRKSEAFSFKDLPSDYPYHNCYFIIVSKSHIKCITYDELKDEKTIYSKSKNYLGSRKEFDLDKKVIIDFCHFAVKFFENV